MASCIGYTGHVQDAATGLTYMQQRYYDPATGRFLSVDPVTADGNTGGNFNRYWYANNNPYRFTDPDGRLTENLVNQAINYAKNAAINYVAAKTTAVVNALPGITSAAVSKHLENNHYTLSLGVSGAAGAPIGNVDRMAGKLGAGLFVQGEAKLGITSNGQITGSVSYGPMGE